MRIRFVLVLLLVPALLSGMDDYAQEALWIKNEAGYNLDTDPLSIARPSANWTPYKGTQPISKTEFFLMAGMEAEARKYASMQTAKNVLAWTSVALLAAGITTLICMPDTDAGRITAIATGASAMALSLSAGIVESRTSVLFSIPLALDTARTYDKKFKEQTKQR